MTFACKGSGDDESTAGEEGSEEGESESSESTSSDASESTSSDASESDTSEGSSDEEDSGSTTGDTSGSDTSDGDTSGSDTSGSDTSSDTSDEDSSESSTSESSSSSGTTTGDDGAHCSDGGGVDEFVGFAIEDDGCDVRDIVGDVNGDELGDLVVALARFDPAPSYGPPTFDFGLVNGQSSEDPIDAEMVVPNSVWFWEHAEAYRGRPLLEGKLDLDGDGLSDFLFGERYDFGMSLLAVYGSQGSALVEHYFPSPEEDEHAAHGDFNGDGMTDVVVTCTDLAGESGPTLLEGAYIVLGNEQRSMPTFEELEGGIGGFLVEDCPYDFVEHKPLIFDWNGDGQDEIGFGRDIVVVLGKEDTDAFDCNNPGSAAFSIESSVRPVVVGDIDDDGFDDLLVGNRIARGRASAMDINFDTILLDYEITRSADDVVLQPADYNGDGVVDLAFANAVTSEVAIVHGRSDFSSVNLTALDPEQGKVLGFSGPQALDKVQAVGDVNGDGCADIAFSPATDGTACAYVRFTPNVP